jgi:hypothetical protein
MVDEETAEQSDIHAPAMRMSDSKRRRVNRGWDLRRHAIFVTVAVIVFAVDLLSAEGEDPWSVKRLFEEQYRLGRKLSAQDAYKLLQQASFGVGHLLVDTAAARQVLFGELASVDTALKGEPLVERISVTGLLVRINLRPFKRQGLSPDSLFAVMVRSSKGLTPDTAQFVRQWTELLSLIRYGLLPPLSGDLRIWEDRVQRGDLGVVHHSPEYVQVYEPAYRVVLKEEFLRTFGRNF